MVHSRSGITQSVSTRCKPSELLIATRRVGRVSARPVHRKAADELQILAAERLRLRLLTVREAAEILRVKPCTLYRLVREKQLAALRVSHAIRIAADEVERFVTGGVPSAP